MPVKRPCPGCDRYIRVHQPKGDPGVLYFQAHYLNDTKHTTPDDRGDRCINGGYPVASAIVVPEWSPSEVTGD